MHAHVEGNNNMQALKKISANLEILSNQLCRYFSIPIQLLIFYCFSLLAPCEDSMASPMRKDSISKE